MPKFSEKSLEKLETCDERLQVLCKEVVKIMDCVVLCGHRNEEEQNKAYKNGHSKAQWGQSKHNSFPSKAVDLAPYPIDWYNKERFARLAGVVDTIAHQYGFRIKWGGDFKNFTDMPHFELED